MARKSFAVFDGDSHVAEPPELWTKYLDLEYRTLGRYALWREEGKWGSYLQVNGKMFRDTMNSNILREPSRIEESLVDAHRVHILEPRL
jgi:hypothetical protein